MIFHREVILPPIITKFIIVYFFTHNIGKLKQKCGEAAGGAASRGYGGWDWAELVDAEVFLDLLDFGVGFGGGLAIVGCCGHFAAHLYIEFNLGLGA